MPLSTLAPLCLGQGRGLRADPSSPGVTLRASDGETSYHIFLLFPTASCVLFDFRKPTAKRPTTGSTTACSCSTAMVRAGSPRYQPHHPPPPLAALPGWKAHQRPGNRYSGSLLLRSSLRSVTERSPVAARAAGTGGLGWEPRRARALGRAPARCHRPSSSHLCLVSGIRTEQDFYVRLIDSMTKQVGAAERPRRTGGWQPSGRPPGARRGGPRRRNPPPLRKEAALSRQGRGCRLPQGTAALPAPHPRNCDRSPRSGGGCRAEPRGQTPASGRRGGSARDPARLRAWELGKIQATFQPS